MNQIECITAPKVNESLLYGVDCKPFTVGAYIFNDMNKTHGLATGKPRLYRIWLYMRQRTGNPNNTNYKYYGGKGIIVCNEWNDFATFHEWAMSHGYKDNLTIDRIKGNKGYCPENCRWITQSENTKNQPTKRIGDWGIYPKKKGYYTQIQFEGVNYYGGYSENIEDVRKLREKLVNKIKNNYQLKINETNLTDDDDRKKIGRDKNTGRFIWYK